MTPFDEAVWTGNGENSDQSWARGFSAGPARQSTIGIASLALGIASCAGTFAGVTGMFRGPAWSMALLSAVVAVALGILGRCRRVVGYSAGREAATAGLVMGSVVVGVTVLFIGWILLMFAMISGAQLG